MHCVTEALSAYDYKKCEHVYIANEHYEQECKELVNDSDIVADYVP